VLVKIVYFKLLFKLDSKVDSEQSDFRDERFIRRREV